MPRTLLSRPEALVAYWRASADDSNPAGPLFSGDYAEFDLTAKSAYQTGHSLCSGSSTVQCC